MTAGWRGDVRIGPIHRLNSTGPYLMCPDKDVCVCLLNSFGEEGPRVYNILSFFLRVEQEVCLNWAFSLLHKKVAGLVWVQV